MTTPPSDAYGNADPSTENRMSESRRLPNDPVPEQPAAVTDNEDGLASGLGDIDERLEVIASMSPLPGSADPQIQSMELRKERAKLVAERHRLLGLIQANQVQ
jgi:hypothetical protein